jgi:hypothetical protein
LHSVIPSWSRDQFCLPLSDLQFKLIHGSALSEQEIEAGRPDAGRNIEKGVAGISNWA